MLVTNWAEVNLKSQNAAALPPSRSTKRHRILELCVSGSIYRQPSLPAATRRDRPHEDTCVDVPLWSASPAVVVNTHPNSIIPSRNSFLLNSHWVAARNFHATTSTEMLAGSRMRSSQNCWIPSMPILFSSWGSIKGGGGGFKGKAPLYEKMSQFPQKSSHFLL